MVAATTARTFHLPGSELPAALGSGSRPLALVRVEEFRLAIVAGVSAVVVIQVQPLPLHRRQRDAELEPRPVVGAQIDIAGEAERHHRFVGGMVVEEPFNDVGVLPHVRQRLRPQHGNAGAPVLSRERDRVHGVMIEPRNERRSRRHATSREAGGVAADA